MTTPGEDDLAEVAEEFRRKGWMIGPGRDGGFDAWFPHVPDLSSRFSDECGLMVLRDETEARVVKRAARFEEVFEATVGDRCKAEQEANDLET